MSGEATGQDVADPIDTDKARQAFDVLRQNVDWYNVQPALALIHPLCDELDKVRAERDDLATRLSGMLCDLTRGRMSKTGYEVRTMVQEIDAVFEAQFEEDHAADIAERDDALRKLARVQELINKGDRTNTPAYRTVNRIENMIGSDIP